MPSFDCCCTLCVYLPVEQRSSVIQRIQRAAAECVALRGVLCNTSFPADPAGGERGTGAGPSTIVCLISPTCHVGMTILSTYLPHRGAVGIPVAALARRFKPPASGATQTHTVLRECLRAKDSPIWAAGAVPCRGCADETHTTEPVRTASRPFVALLEGLASSSSVPALSLSLWSALECGFAVPSPNVLTCLYLSVWRR